MMTCIGDVLGLFGSVSSYNNNKYVLLCKKTKLNSQSFILFYRFLYHVVYVSQIHINVWDKVEQDWLHVLANVTKLLIPD